eukprot:2491902-Ditylum_brightwellii.AAC.3
MERSVSDQASSMAEAAPELQDSGEQRTDSLASPDSEIEDDNGPITNISEVIDELPLPEEKRNSSLVAINGYRWHESQL